jgi:16S rRNA (adenine1518-N6/adenine1519-N6)-dimethyltransferase
MHLARPSEVKAWCLEHDFHPNRTLGQNFLVDGNILDAIVAAAELRPGARVLEVGPGLGVVTEALLEAGAAVTAVEKDGRLAQWLRASLGARGGLTLIEADMLDLDLDRLLAGEGAPAGAGRSPTLATARPCFTACVSNLPYSAGTRILLDLCRHPLAPPLLAVTLQHEVAERLAAPPGGRARGLAGVWVQQNYDVALLRTIKPACFWPRPEVGSTLARLTRHERLPLDPRQRHAFESLTRHAFMHRRKQMQALLRLPAPGLPTDHVAWEPLLAKVGIPPAARPEELSTPEWCALATSICGV